MKNSWKLKIHGFYLIVETHNSGGFTWQWFYIDDHEQSSQYLCETFLDAVQQAFYLDNAPKNPRPPKPKTKEEIAAMELLLSCIM